MTVKETAQQVQDRTIRYCYYLLSERISSQLQDDETDLGFLTPPDINRELLSSRFSNEAVKYACELLAQNKILDVYYICKCDRCQESVYLEEDEYHNRETLRRVKGGEAFAECPHCGKQCVSFEEDQKRFTIPKHYLYQGEPSREGVMYTIRSWLRSFGEVFVTQEEGHE